MPLSLTLTFGEPPVGSEFPGTPKALGDFLAQYLVIAGGEDFQSINFGPTTPTEENRDKPWFKTDNLGKPLGWFSWDGEDWTNQPDLVKAGPTAQRPEGIEGLQYLDTDIDVLLIFERGAWRTASGSPGDIKLVKAETIDEALGNNPGWIQDPDSKGRVFGAAGTGDSLTPRAYGATVGAETHTLSATEVPEHSHSLPWAQFGGQHQNGTQGAGIYPVVTGAGSMNTSTTPATGTGGIAHNNMQPTIFYWALLKE